ncbi:MAG: ABC transporter permease [Chloroflexi bacterium]|nr:ABC transporter permease [Chloroflexota bacterium]
MVLHPASAATEFGAARGSPVRAARRVTRGSLIVDVGAMLVGLGIATIVGGVSACAAGWVDAVLQRLVDAVLALPWLVLAMSVLALAGPGRLNTLLVIGVLTAPGLSRVIRGAVPRLRGMAFVEAARATGCPPWWILWRHLLPNIRSGLIVLGSISVGGALLSESALSFLGFGVVPPEPAWGYMLGVEGRRFLTTAPWLAIFPSAATALVVCSATLVGDALRDALDPRR